MKKQFAKLISLIIITLLVLSGIAVAEASAKVDFVAKEADDIIVLTVKVKNTTFMGIQVTLKYNTKELLPIDVSGNEAMRYADFSSVSAEAKVFSTAGLNLDTENGKIDFTYYIMPGAESDKINESNEFVADETGIDLCTFRFKKLSEDYSFELDTDRNGELRLSIMDYANGDLEANVSFSYPEKEAESVIITPPVKEEKPEFTSEDRKKDVTCLQIGKGAAFAKGKKAAIDAENNKVVPYISNNRTFVPVRFIAETLGAEVLWEKGWDGCIIKQGETEIKLTFNSNEFYVNGQKVTYDAPIELVHDRTMVPIRFISEQLGCDVYWNDTNNAVVISPLGNKWQELREAEITALSEMLITISGLLP